MADIKPAEVSQILKQQLEGFQSVVELEEVGTVLQVGDGIAVFTACRMLNRTKWSSLTLV